MVYGMASALVFGASALSIRSCSALTLQGTAGQAVCRRGQRKLANCQLSHAVGWLACSCMVRPHNLKAHSLNPALHMPASPAPNPSILCRLSEEGLSSERWSAAAQAYIAGQGGHKTLDQAVSAIKAAKQEVTDRDARRTRITELFTQQGLQEYLPDQHAWGGGWGGWGGECAAAGYQGAPV